MFITVELKIPASEIPRLEKLILIYPNENPLHKDDGVMVGMSNEEWMTTEIYKKILENEVARAEKAYANKMAREAMLAAQVTAPLQGLGLKITMPDGTVIES